jgi:hypothetical protein
MLTRCGAFLSLLCLAACGGDDLPDSTRSSVNLETNNLRMEVRVLAQDAETDPADNGVHVNVDLYRITSDGYIQMIDLQEGDNFSLTAGASNVTLTKNLYPNANDVRGVDYSTKLNSIIDGEILTLALNRQAKTDAPNTTAKVLVPTVFSVVPSSTPLTQSGNVTLNWTPVTGYEYEVSFRFSCGANSDQVVQGIRFPNRHSPNAPVSPFVFSFADYFVYPSDSNSNLTNCQLRASLWSYEDQSELGDAAFENVSVSSVRVQRISTAIQRN